MIRKLVMNLEEIDEVEADEKSQVVDSRVKVMQCAAFPAISRLEVKKLKVVVSISI